MFSICIILICLSLLLIQKIIFPKESILIAPIFFVVFSQIYFFSAPPRFFSEYSIDVLIYHIVSIFLLSITLIIFHIKYLQREIVKVKVFDFNENYFLYCAIIFLLIPYIIFLLNGIDIFSILTRFYKTSIFEDSRLEKYSTIINLITRSVYLLMIISRFLFNYTTDKKYKIAWYFFLILSVVTVMSTGVRSGLIFLVLSIIIVDVCCFGNIFSKKFLKNIFIYIVIGLLVLPSIFILSQFRNTSFDNFQDFKSNITLENLTNSSSVEDTNFYNLNDMVAYSVNHYSQDPCLMCSVKMIILIPIPRFIWPEKPVGFGKQLAHDMAGAPLQGPGLSLAAGLPGEATYNLGVWGIIIFPIIFGALLSLAFGVLKYSAKVFLASCGLFFLISYIGTYRGDWLSIPSFFINCLFVYVVILISKLISRVKIKL